MKFQNYAKLVHLCNTIDVVKNFSVMKNAAVSSFHCSSDLCGHTEPKESYETSLVAN